MRDYRILTLQDNNCLGCYDGTLGADPMGIITGSIPLLNQIFPNLFGGNRRRLTQADWNQMFPGNGYWTVRLKNYLARHTHYDVDLKYLYDTGNGYGYIINFIAENRAEIWPQRWQSVQQLSYPEQLRLFEDVINEEKFTGGNSPVSQVKYLQGSMDFSKILPIAGVVLVVGLLMSKK